MTAVMDVPVTDGGGELPELLQEAFLEQPEEARDYLLSKEFLETGEEAEAYFRERLMAAGVALPESATPAPVTPARLSGRKLVFAAGEVVADANSRSGRSSVRSASAPLSEAALRRKKVAKYIYYGVGISVMLIMWIIIALVVKSMGWIN